MSIQIEGLKKSYNKNVVLEINQAEIKTGETVCILGRNGSGKSTLIKLMLDLIKADTGHVVINGYRTDCSEHWKSLVGAYLNEDFLIPFLTPDEYFDFLGITAGLDTKEVRLRLQVFDLFFDGEILEQKKYIRELSDGNKQKVGIASVFLASPKVVLLDEPFKYLDPAARFFLKNYLTKYSENGDKTILFSSHDIHDMMKICTRFWVMEQGRIIQDIKNESGVFESLISHFMDKH